MRKNINVLQINGIRGLLLALFVGCCLIAGFIVFPSLLVMHSWNFVALKTGSMHSINFTGGILLWAIIVLSSIIFNKKRFIISFNSRQELTEDEVREVISKIKSQAINKSISLPKDFNPSKESINEASEIQEVKTDSESK